MLAFVFDMPAKFGERSPARDFIGNVAAGFAQSGKPSLMLSHAFSTISSEGREVADELKLTYTGSGIHLGIRALAHLQQAGKYRPGSRPAVFDEPVAAHHPRNERAVLDHLSSHGVAVIPATLVTSSAQAAQAAAAAGGPVVLKIASVDIAHKTDAGGVALNVTGPEKAAAAFDEIMRRVKAAQPSAAIDGVIVSPMRTGGVELFVGTLRDPQWGPCIAVGLGGVWVEVLKDSSLRLLPINQSDALQMLQELRGSPLLDGFRGTPAMDRADLARCIVAIGNAALALGPDLVALEVNPLLASAQRVEALDGLAVWNDP
jgi:acetate---CoA ligase (ADP-forming)